MDSPNKSLNILFMCVANSARSQLADGLACNIFKQKAIVRSAGSKPSHVNPYAIMALKQIGINIQQNRSKSFYDLDKEFIDNLDYVITLCDEEVCPQITKTKAQVLHWPFPDPANKGQSQQQKQNIFRKTRANIQNRIKQFKEMLALQQRRLNK